MQASIQILFLITAVALIACIAWLHWRAFQDGAIQDVLLFLTGVSTFFYIVGRWERAKRPFLGIIGSSAVLAIVVAISSTIGAVPHEPPPEELAAEVKPLILQEWSKQAEFGNATIQRIALVHKGDGLYSGFIESTVRGRAERFPLNVVFHRDSIRWEIKPISP